MLRLGKSKAASLVVCGCVDDCAPLNSNGAKLKAPVDVTVLSGSDALISPLTLNSGNSKDAFVIGCGKDDDCVPLKSSALKLNAPVNSGCGSDAD